MTDESLVVVGVEDVIDPALTGRVGCRYQSPAQPLEQALALVQVLLGYTNGDLNGARRWTCPVAGGRRTVWLTSQPSSEGLRQSTT